MSDESDKVDEILDELDLGGDVTATTPESAKDEETVAEEETDSKDRLSLLHDAGAITDEEYEVLQAHFEGGESSGRNPESDPTPDTVEFGNPLATSEGTEIDFSLIGVFNGVDNSRLLLPDYLDHVKEEDLPPTHEGGPGRTIVFLLMHNHSDREIKLWNKDFELIGSDQIAYNQRECPVSEDKLRPGWRGGDKIYISPDTRVKYACGAEMPVDVEEVRINSDCADVHTISVTDEMRFPKSELPVTVHL